MILHQLSVSDASDTELANESADETSDNDFVSVDSLLDFAAFLPFVFVFSLK